MTAPPHAVLLCAGLGSRLLPLTADRPKCLIEVGGRTILEHQLDALRAAGVAGATVIGGYRFDRLRAFVGARWPDPAARPALAFNPFFAISSSIGSVWAARDRLRAPFCILNGDTVYDPALVADGLARARRAGGVSLFVEPAPAPAPDDMLVRIEGGRVAAVGKTLPPATARHRSLGLVVGDGSAGYRAALDAVIAGPDGVQAFHHAVVDRLARTDAVTAIDFAHGAWTEIDRPEDIARWTGAPA